MHGDILGSLRLTTQGQSITDTLLYDAFGSLLVETSAKPTPLKFVGSKGYQSDGETHLQLLGHRYYNPLFGRFISSDPIQDGDNWYDYCENDPLGKTDPSGEAFRLGGGPDAGSSSAYADAPVGDEVHTTASEQPAGTDPDAAGSAAGDNSSSGATVRTVADKLDIQKAKDLINKIDNHTREINKRLGELDENKGPQGGQPLPERAPGDTQSPRLSKWGHRGLIDKLKAQRGNYIKQLEGLLEKAGIAARGLFSNPEGLVPIVIFRDPKTGQPLGMYPQGPRA